jgi:membrane protease YdiL (CAAX protease family)
VPRITPRTRDLVEIVLAYGLILTVIWTPNPPQRILYWITFAAIIILTLLRREGLTTLGLGVRGALPSLWVIGVALLFSVLAVWLAFRLHTLHSLFGQAPVFSHIWGYLLWSLMQQFLLQSYFLSRVLRVTPRRWQAVAIVALLFAVAHIPNPVLTLLTLIWGTISCFLFLRYRNLYTLGIAHGILGICLAVTIPDHIHRHMRVGLGYLHYHTHVWSGRR